MGLFGKEENGGLKLLQIIELSFYMLPGPFPKKLQAKIGCSDDFIQRIKKALPKNITCKIESCEDGSGLDYQRAKVWERFNDKGFDYSEIEDIGYLVDRPFSFWVLMFWELMTEEEQNSTDPAMVALGSMRIQAVFDFEMQSFLIIISGAQFEKEHDSMVDLRPLKDKITDDAILLKLNPYDYKSLETFDVANAFSMPDDPDFYYATDYYRRYSNSRCGKPGSEDSRERGICWVLQLYDFTRKIFPKVEANKTEKK